MRKHSVRLLFLFLTTITLLFTGCHTGQEVQTEDTAATDPTEQTQPYFGWITENGQTRYLLPDGTYLTGWLSLEGGKYYLDDSGCVIYGQAVIDGNGYFFDNDGHMVTGIVIFEEIAYLYDSDGIMAAAGWADHNGQTYYIIENGQIYTGWLRLDDASYYLKNDGTMAVGKTQIGEDIFYFTPDGIHVTLVNPWHFLPENYVVELAEVRGHQVDVRCAEALEQMLSACAKAGNDPRICSAYRSYDKQEKLYRNKVNRLMALGHQKEEAEKLAGTEVAVPGTSEHHLGLAVDIVDASNWNLDETQAKTPSQLWLMEHCWEFGFILRYPNEKSVITGIIYEPWHYRYVGVEIAMKLKDSGLSLEEYLDAVVE